ncbi:MAG: hypothetical protein KAR20_29860, partial [Candidatus Heimdallarchaeota archaeon]|nr:hypothetical protein [Candidatus Heimdallarchaeota archaeon]
LIMIFAFIIVVALVFIVIVEIFDVKEYPMFDSPIEEVSEYLLQQEGSIVRTQTWGEWFGPVKTEIERPEYLDVLFSLPYTIGFQDEHGNYLGTIKVDLEWQDYHESWSARYEEGYWIKFTWNGKQIMALKTEKEKIGIGHMRGATK